jgi:anti-sigma regulatory factor (Ser/Thr protein kinase)
MSYAGMAGMRATLGDVSGLIGALDDGKWATASAAAGWTVKDVVAHFGDLLGILASAIDGTLSTDLGIERLNDAHIAAKSSWSPGQVAADLERQQVALLPQLESHPPAVGRPRPARPAGRPRRAPAGRGPGQAGGGLAAGGNSQVYDIVAAAHELAANTVRHGAGHGRLRLWADGQALHCQVSDDGPADQDPARQAAAAWQSEHAHGRWIIDQVADQVSLDRATSGNTVTVIFLISSPSKRIGILTPTERHGFRIELNTRR